MVKISSETIPSGKFYDRFFGLVDHYLHTVVRTSPVAPNNVVSRVIPPDPVNVIPADLTNAAPADPISAMATDHADAAAPASDASVNR
jgi:hypothetical protein